jgi:hypothetical protein
METLPPKSEHTTLNIEVAIHRRVLKFLNEAHSAEDLLNGKRFRNPEVAKSIIEYRDRQFPLGFKHVNELQKLDIFTDLAEFLDQFGAATSGQWRNFPHPIPRWGRPGREPNEGVVHAAMLRTGKVLFITADETTILWDPLNLAASSFELPLNQPDDIPLGYSQLCSHHVFLSDGRFLAVGGGGYGHNDNAIFGFKFDPVARTWSRTTNSMSESRWYPTAINLGNKKVLVVCGHGSGEMDVYDESTDSFTKVDLDTKPFPSLYPGLHLLPDDKIFYSRTGWGNAGPGQDPGLPTDDDQSAFFTFSSPLAGSWTNISPIPPNVDDRTKGMSVLLVNALQSTARVVVFGGVDPLTNNTFESIDATSLSPSSNWGSPQPFPDGEHRSLCSSVLLPDGTVFIAGGIQAVNSPCAIFNPATNTWSPMADLPSERHYHSVSLLLPNGEVMMAGWHNTKIEIFTPPYLLIGDQPEIVSAPEVIQLGQTFDIFTRSAGSIAKVVLVRPMAVTHQTDTEQRVVELQFTTLPGEPTRISATAPVEDKPSALAPPGFYMLFILNREGVPSVARFVQLTDLRFKGRPAVFPTNAEDNKKSIYTTSLSGRLCQSWDTSHWNMDFPAELANQAMLKFQEFPAVFARDAASNKKAIYMVTTDGRLAQIWDTTHWELDFPAELAGHAQLRFQHGVAVFPTNAQDNKKAIYAITTDGRLAQIWDTDHWELDFPAELAGHAQLRFKGIAAVFPTNAADNKKSIYAITTDGRLAQIWDSNQWELDFPAELAGHGSLRFQPFPAVFATNGEDNKKSIYVITEDGRLAQIWDTDHWELDFPAEAAGFGSLRFQQGVTVFSTNAEDNKKAIYAITTDGRLAQIWDSNRWELDFPAELAGHAQLRFQGIPAVFPTNAEDNKKSIYAITTDGRLAQVWDTNQWKLDFPNEL